MQKVFQSKSLLKKRVVLVVGAVLVFSVSVIGAFTTATLHSAARDRQAIRIIIPICPKTTKSCPSPTQV